MQKRPQGFYSNFMLNYSRSHKCLPPLSPYRRANQHCKESTRAMVPGSAGGIVHERESPWKTAVINHGLQHDQVPLDRVESVGYPSDRVHNQAAPHWQQQVFWPPSTHVHGQSPCADHDPSASIDCRWSPSFNPTKVVFLLLSLCMASAVRDDASRATVESSTSRSDCGKPETLTHGLRTS